MRLIPLVRAGDPNNVEARAAQIYWPRLFGPAFRRDRNIDGINSLLNYGYSLIRSAVARAIVGSGLHPTIGIHHTNQYNAFCLADDLMEPFRPLIDVHVYRVAKDKECPPIDTATKHGLLSQLTGNCVIETRSVPFLQALASYTASVARVFARETPSASIPVPSFNLHSDT
jgi:CRISP-associated protein Cas1